VAERTEEHRPVRAGLRLASVGAVLPPGHATAAAVGLDQCAHLLAHPHQQPGQRQQVVGAEHVNERLDVPVW